MIKPLFQMQYYDTYYYAQIVHSIIMAPFQYLRTLDTFFGELQYPKFLRVFPRLTSLHLFIDFSFELLLAESVDDIAVDGLVNIQGYELWVSQALRFHQIDHSDFHDWYDNAGRSLKDLSEDDIYDYHEYLYEMGPLTYLQEQITQEVFFLLFLNRQFLKRFHEAIAGHISTVPAKALAPEYKSLFRHDGVLKRQRIPVWAKRAVFFRDRGLCSLCHKDISGLVNLSSQRHFDHIVPLALGGTNELTNFQLLCSDCNLRKSQGSARTSDYYERWY